jgi:transposase-like protein
MKCKQIILDQEGYDYTCVLGSESSYYFTKFSQDNGTFFCPVCETQDAKNSIILDNKFSCEDCNSKFEIIDLNYWGFSLAKIKQIYD